MKKFLWIALVTAPLFYGHTAAALQLVSNNNGKVVVSEPQLRVGELAPKITLTTPKFKRKAVGGATGKIQIISTIQSLCTTVCDQQTMLLNTAAKRLKNVEVTLISTDTPFVLEDFKTKHSPDRITLLSAFHNEMFGNKYGVQVIGGELTGHLARSIFVVDTNGKILYKEIPHNINTMPNLAAAISAAEKANS